MARGGNPNPKPGPGRPKGCPNKNTTYVRDMISYFLEKRVDLIDDLFLQVAKDSPVDALRIMLGMFEYVTPKMARHEQTGIDGEPIKTSLKVTICD